MNYTASNKVSVIEGDGNADKWLNMKNNNNNHFEVLPKNYLISHDSLS